MAESMLLGLFHEATPTADTVDQLAKLGIPDNSITVMSGVPYRPEMLGRRARYEWLVPIALVGALSGFLAAIFLTVGTPLLYPLYQGSQPLIPPPPSLIILFEFTMLGTMVATFAGLLAASQFPGWGHEVYDHRITEGHIGVLVRVPTTLTDQAEEVLKANGAHHLRRIEGRLFERRGRRFPTFQRVWANRSVIARWVLILIILAVPTLIAMAFAYSLFYIPIPDQMVNQPSLAYEMGPRQAAPAAAVPVQGPALINNVPGTQPLPATANSIQRGSVLYGVTCRICHGPQGKGNGPVGGFFTPKPRDLTAPPVTQMTDQDIFVVITLGRGAMPNLRENLTIADRWDVINFVRTLK